MPQAEFTIPDVGRDDAVVLVEACGLCGSDHGFYTGDANLGYFNFIPGHETVGVIEKIGPEAERLWGVREGDRVAIDNRLACRNCARCAAGDFAFCLTFGGPESSYGLTTIDEPPSLWGGYATHHYLRRETIVHRVAERTSAVEATLFNPVGAGIYWAVDTPGTREGEAVAVLGPGIRGLASVAAVKQAGAGFIMVTGFGERDHSRLQLAKQLGADLVVDVAKDDPVEAMESVLGRRADVVVEVTHSAPTIIEQAIALADPGGRVVLAGAAMRQQPSAEAKATIATRNLRVIPQHGVSSAARAKALEWIAGGLLDPGLLPREEAGFEGLGDLLLRMAGEGGVAPVHAVFVPDN
jgi:alcohol dehydrogenase